MCFFRSSGELLFLSKVCSTSLLPSLPLSHSPSLSPFFCTFVASPFRPFLSSSMFVNATSTCISLQVLNRLVDCDRESQNFVSRLRCELSSPFLLLPFPLDGCGVLDFVWLCLLARVLATQRYVTSIFSFLPMYLHTISKTGGATAQVRQPLEIVPKPPHSSRIRSPSGIQHLSSAQRRQLGVSLVNVYVPYATHF